MDLELTGDQRLMRDATADYIADNFPIAKVRGLAEGAPAVPADYLRNGAQLGWFSLLVREEDGGGSVSGHGLGDLAILARARGRQLQAGPFVSMSVAAMTVSHRGSPRQRAELLPDLVEGRTVAAWADATRPGEATAGATVTARLDGGGFALSGTAGLVPDAVQASWLLVTARSPTGLRQFVVATDTPGVTITALESLDPTQRLAAVEFTDVRVEEDRLIGPDGPADEDAERQLQVAIALSVAETVGVMESVFERTQAYALDRVAFGRPIGSFQAVKHQLANLSLAVETSSAVANAVATAVDARRADAGEIASIAKAWVGDAAVDVAQGCFQVFGGIGYTWEHDFHLYFRRLSMSSLFFGSSDWHRARICALHEL